MARPKKFRIPVEEVTQPDNARKVAGHVAEIEFLRKQIKDLQENIADIYDAADDDGFDKKFIRLAVARRAKDPEAARTVEAGVDAYEEAIDLGFSSRARVENPDHDAETGEIIEPSNMHNLHIAPQPATDPKQSVAAVTVTPDGEGGEGGTAGTSAALLATHMPETANEPEAPELTTPDPLRSDAAAREDAGSEASARNTREGAPATEGDDAPPTSSVVAAKKLKMNHEFFDAPHPACQRPEFCGGNSNLGLCDKCKAAAGMIPVVPGGTDIEHRGPIN